MFIALKLAVAKLFTFCLYTQDHYRLFVKKKNENYSFKSFIEVNIFTVSLMYFSKTYLFRYTKNLSKFSRHLVWRSHKGDPRKALIPILLGFKACI